MGRPKRELEEGITGKIFENSSSFSYLILQTPVYAQGGEMIQTQMHLGPDDTHQPIITSVSEVETQSTDILQQAAAEVQ